MRPLYQDILFCDIIALKLFCLLATKGYKTRLDIALPAKRWDKVNKQEAGGNKKRSLKINIFINIYIPVNLVSFFCI